MSGFATFPMKFTGLLLALGTLAGCNEITAQPAPPQRPVLVTAVKYQRQSADRSFVGTVRPRIRAARSFISSCRPASKRAPEEPAVSSAADICAEWPSLRGAPDLHPAKGTRSRTR